jgi:hypothetical protein
MNRNNLLEKKYSDEGEENKERRKELNAREIIR